ncbi:MAG: hypothetical protein ABIQ52_21060, partial [Vicinamibacterales bacterium]
MTPKSDCWLAVLLCALGALCAPMSTSAAAQQNPAVPATAQPRPPRPPVPMDAERAQRLYVSADPKEHSTGTNFERDIAAKQKIDERYTEITR